MLSWSWRLNGRESMTSFFRKILDAIMSSISLFTKFKMDTYVGTFLFREMIFIDVKSFVSIVPNTKR